MKIPKTQHESPKQHDQILERSRLSDEEFTRHPGFDFLKAGYIKIVKLNFVPCITNEQWMCVFFLLWSKKS